MSELLILRLRNKIADKETIIACANMELSKGGWTCAWDHELQRVNIEIDEILNKLEGTNRTIERHTGITPTVTP